MESAPVTIGHLHSRDTALRFADELKAIGCVADTCKIKWLVRGEIIGIDLGSGSIHEPI